MRSSSLLLALVSLVLLPAAARADVDTFVVTSTADPGNGSCATDGCTLREALTEANDGDAAGEVDRVELRFRLLGTSTITLGTALPAATEPLHLAGAARQLDRPVIDGSASLAAVLRFEQSATVERLVVRDGPDVCLSAAKGLVLRDSVVSGCRSSGLGGGVRAAGPLVVEGSVITGCEAAFGGGIYARDEVSIVRSTLTANRADIFGGALHADRPVSVLGSTLSGNEGPDAAAYLIAGGAFVDTTITANGASPLRTSRVLDLRSTVIAGNGPPGTKQVWSSNGGVVRLDRAHLGRVDPEMVTEVPGSDSTVNGPDPQLGPLGAHGGATPTHVPQPGSPLIDAGVSTRTTDQRGEASPVDDPAVANAVDGSDIGSVEAPAPPPPPAPPVPPAAAPAPTPAPADPDPTPASAPAPAPSATTAGSGGSAATPPVVRGFGRTPGVAVRLLDRRPTARGMLRVRLRNANAFPVAITVRTRARSGGRAAARKPFTLRAGRTTTLALRLPRTLRRAGARRGLTVTATLRDPLRATRTVTVRGGRYRLAR